MYDSSCSSDAVVYYIDTGYYVRIDDGQVAETVSIANYLCRVYARF